MTYAEFTSLLTAMSPGALSGGFVDQDTGSPSELAFYARMTNMELAGGPYFFKWALREYELTLDGSEEYNLGTLIPDLAKIYQVSGEQVPGFAVGYQSLQEFNISVGTTNFTVIGNTIRFRNPPTSGVLTIPYYSNYLVKSSGGTRKLDFTDPTDISVIPNHWSMLLTEGALRFVARKEKEEPYAENTQLHDGRVVKMTLFEKFKQQAILADSNVDSPVYDFRYSA